MAEAHINLFVSFGSRSEAEGYFIYSHRREIRRRINQSVQVGHNFTHLVANVAEGEELLGKVLVLFGEEEKKSVRCCACADSSTCKVAGNRQGIHPGSGQHSLPPYKSSLVFRREWHWLQCDFLNSHTYVIDPRIGVVQHTFELFPTTTASRRDTWRTPRCRLEFTRSDLAELCLCIVWLPGGEGLLLEGRRRRRTVVGSSRCSASRANCTHHAGRQFHEPHQEPAALAVDQTAEEPDGEPHQQGTFTVCARAL